MKSGHSLIFLACIILLVVQSCDRNDDEMPDHRYGYGGGITYNILIDSTQVRLDSNANPSIIPPGHGSLSPSFNFLQVNGLSLLNASDSSDVSTVYPSKEIHGSSGTFEGSFHYNGGPMTFNFLRIYFSFQNFEVQCLTGGNLMNVNVLSFMSLGYYPYTSFVIHDSIVPHPIQNRGEWFMEIDSTGFGVVLHGQTSMITEPDFLNENYYGQVQDYALTCPINPPITFTGDQHHTLSISISSNKCFEWIEHSTPGIFEPLDGDTIYDFGLRGAKVIQ